MAPPISSRWTTDSEYIELLNYIVERAENAKSPINIQRMVREFKEKSGAVKTVECLSQRIERMRTHIHSFDHIDTDMKVKISFALSASINPDFLKKLKKNAVVEIDEKKRIIYYKANDGSIELRGDHSQSAKLKTALLGSERCYSKLIRDYFENKNDIGKVPRTKEEKEMKALIEFISEKCHNVNTPLSIEQLAKDFTNHFGLSIPLGTSVSRVRGYCREIQKGEFLNIHTKVRQLFGLSARIDPDYLKELRKDALVEVDYKNRIVHYKANDGSLELTGCHSMPAKANQSRSSSRRSSMNSPFPSISAESEENMENLNALEVEGNPSGYYGARIQEMEGFDYNPREDNIPETSPTDNRLQEQEPFAVEEPNLNNESQNTDNRSDAVAPESKLEKENLAIQNNQNSTSQTNGSDADDHNVNKETQNTDKESDADVPEPKPDKESLTLQTNGNEFVSIENHIQILESLLHMMDTLDSPTFAEDKLRIEKTIEKFKSIGNEEEKLQMNEIKTSFVTCLLTVEKNAKKRDCEGRRYDKSQRFCSRFSLFPSFIEVKRTGWICGKSETHD